jgi:hypothetical protein
MRVLGILALAIMLGGCFGAGQREQVAHQPGEGEDFASRQDLDAKDDAICRGYGAQPGTPAYINCRGQQDQRRTAWKTQPN